MNHQRKDPRVFRELMSRREIGEQLGISRERVRQIEVEALRKLRLALRERGMTWEDLYDREYEVQVRFPPEDQF